MSGEPGRIPPPMPANGEPDANGVPEPGLAPGVSESEPAPEAPAADAGLETLCALAGAYMAPEDVAFVADAYSFSKRAHEGQRRKSGEPYFVHVLEVAFILARLRLDREAVAAGLLHDTVEDTGTPLKTLEQRFGPNVALLVDGVTKIGHLNFASIEHEQAENFRKMLLSMVRDVRIILIKLADRLHNMRTLEFHSEDKRRAIAQETLEIYAPLAHRLGIGVVKWELEDLSFKHLEPEAYRQIEEEIGLKRTEREEYIERVTEPILARLQEAGIQAEINGRAKHFYSIYKKMRSREKSLAQMYDLLALRVIVPTVRDCYHALGILHTLYTPIHERFKDYIATPKSNMYRSLHTTVVGPGGHVIEIQIRTFEMHRTNEYGIAAHWKYKEEGKTDSQLDAQLQWLRQMLEWQQDLKDPREFMESLKIDLFQHEVFVFTPKGHLRQLPRSATPIDFAYAIHTEIGNRTIGARVNGRIVPLHSELKNGDTVEIITSAAAHPTLHWLQVARTGRARNKIKHWIKSQRHAESVTLGRDLLERELRSAKITFDLDRNLTEIAQIMGHEDAEKLLAAIGNGNQSLQAVVNRIRPPQPRGKIAGFIPKPRVERPARGGKGIEVQGVGNLMIRFAHCCAPVPGDRIMGIITKGRGISVHRHDCINVVGSSLDPERLVQVSWDAGEGQSFPVRIVVTGDDRTNLLADISKKISSTGTNIHSGDFASEDGLMRCTFIVDVRNLKHLSEVLAAVRTVKSVRNVVRDEGH
jgi:GTP diphosphokinase / guanosine-3',5'-bis(diphosphate) 3'-diphosphatase